MKVARQELPGKVKLTEESRQGRLNGVYHRRFAKSANSTSSIPTKKPTAEKSSQNTGRCFSNGMVPVKNRFSRPSRDSLIVSRADPAVPAGLFSIAPVGASSQRLNPKPPLPQLCRRCCAQLYCAAG